MTEPAVENGAPNSAPEGNQPVAESTPPVEVPTRPEHIPEKFWDAEKGEVRVDELANSYVELEKLGAKPKDPPQEAPDGTEGDPNEQPRPNPYAAALERAEAELAEGVELSDETYQAFESQGITRDQVDLHIEGQKAIFELRKLKSEIEVGGADVYKGMIDWAGATFSAEEAVAYNNAVFGGSEEDRQRAVAGLKQRYEEQMGTEGRIVTDGTGGAGTSGYASKQEWLADTRKPEYKKDPAFRDAVAKKLSASLQSGVDMGVGISYTGR